MKAMVIACMFALLTGCVITPKDLGFVQLGSTKRYANEQVYAVGSGIQWNQDYVVSAKHVGVTYLNGTPEYTCDTGCDLQFIRRSADDNNVPQWRSPVANEALTAVGMTLEVDDLNPQKVRRVSVAKQGVDVNIVVQTESNGNNDVRLARITTQSGMSGGPIYGADNKVVGMLTSTVNYSYQGKVQPMAVYLPYDLVKMQWEHFQAKQAKLASIQ